MSLMQLRRPPVKLLSFSRRAPERSNTFSFDLAFIFPLSSPFSSPEVKVKAEPLSTAKNLRHLLRTLSFFFLGQSTMPSKCLRGPVGLDNRDVIQSTIRNGEEEAYKLRGDEGKVGGMTFPKPNFWVGLQMRAVGPGLTDRAERGMIGRVTAEDRNTTSSPCAAPEVNER